MRKNILLTIIFIFIAQKAFSIPTECIFPYNQSNFLLENILYATEKNSYPKIFAKNLMEFEDFLYRNNLYSASPEIQANSKFIPPIFNTPENEPLKSEKSTPIIVTCLYLNALKDAKIADLQKEKITIYKELFDLSKQNEGIKEIAQTTSDYMDAQVELLEYQKAQKLCFKQIANFVEKDFENPETDKFDQFDIKDPIEKVLLQDFKNIPSKEGLQYKLRCDYAKYKLFDEKIKKIEKNSQQAEYFTQLQDKIDIIEIKKRQANIKLACLVDYISLLNY